MNKEVRFFLLVLGTCLVLMYPGTLREVFYLSGGALLVSVALAWWLFGKKQP